MNALHLTLLTFAALSPAPYRIDNRTPYALRLRRRTASTPLMRHLLIRHPLIQIPWFRSLDSDALIQMP